MSNISHSNVAGVLMQEIRARDALIEQIGEALDTIESEDGLIGTQAFNEMSAALTAYREWKEREDENPAR